ncbi:MAG: ABC transporter permease [Cytophagales bacterium]|nr:MAG: ABC transporter permease [Cytophagales bacterium]
MLNTKINWWKYLTIALVIYTVVAGLLTEVPRLPILNETIRNLYFHVPMWFCMTVLLLISVIYSILYLVKPEIKNDFYAVETANTGIFFGILGLITGSIWAKYTWGTFWTSDPKLNAAAIGELIYIAYIILRGSFQDEQQRARIGAVYNLFAFPIFISIIYIIPRLTDSLHPGNGGNPAFSQYDLDSRMRLVFYPAVAGFILLGVWFTSLRVRLRMIEYQIEQ